MWIAAILCMLALPAGAQHLLTMEKAMDIAQANSPNIRTSLMNLEQHKQLLIAQRASLKSRFSLDLSPLDYSKDRRFDNRLSQWYTNESFSSGGLFHVDQPILLTDGVLSLNNRFLWQNNNSEIEGVKNNNKAFTNSLYLQLVQPVFTYNTRKMALKKIEFDLENANIDYALQRLNTEKLITNQFYSVYMSQNNLDISREELENAKKSHEIIKDKVEADLAAKDELFQAELNLATARSTVEENLASLEDAKDQLKKALGMDLNEELSVVANIAVDSILIDEEKAITHGLGSRLELRQREIQSELLEFQLIQTKDDNKFKGQISLSLGLTGDDKQFGDIYNNATQNPRVSITLSVPIFDWGANKARVRAQKIAMEMNDLNAHEERVDVELNIRQVCRNLQKLRTQIEIAAQNVTNAQLTYDLNQTRYREGDITGMEMNQFQTQLSNKKMAYAQAQINYKIELLNIKILSLYDFEKDVAIVPLEEFKN
ncbi:MAG: TolC family protein [Tannerella sp.]|jgi:outer membrane protein TolC|nr:TolC family protein [Tannerella sp.]